jgi:magnesium chelatase family protein
MVYQALSVSEAGGYSQLVTVECNITNGLPSIIIVGFANRAVDEAKERLRSAFHASKINFPKKRITINLAPADVQKDGTAYDIAMAASIMGSSGLIPKDLDGSSSIFIGELGLNGQIRTVRGIIGKLIAAKNKGYSRFFIPTDNLAQSKLVPGLELVPLGSLSDLYHHLSGTSIIRPVKTSHELPARFGSDGLKHDQIDFSDISGQERAKRVLEIAAAGGHNVLFNGPPGTGKSMLAKALIGILPDMSVEEVLEATHLHSLANSDYDRIISRRPFRSPHHSASEVSITGGGQTARPGEISLAHNGVLFLDELPEYRRSTIESLRQPLEDKMITVARAKQNATYPANFIMIATSNPCPCGFYGTSKNCTCLPHALANYQRKISGPIIDRIDLYSEVDGVEHRELMKHGSGKETSSEVKERTQAARNLQTSRYGSPTKTNAVLSNRELKQHAKLAADAESLLNQAAEQLQISARSYMKLVKVARTIADLDKQEQIGLPHISEAIQYRRTIINI